MFSSTTTELSTIMPTPSASPPSVIRLRVKPPKYSSAKVATTDIGMASEITTVLRRLRRKNSSTSTASEPPYSTDCATLAIERSMKLPWLITGTMRICGNSRLSSSTSASTRCATSTVFASACLRIATRRPRSPLIRITRVSFS